MATVSFARGNTCVCSFLPFHISTFDITGEEAVAASAVAAASAAMRFLLGSGDPGRGAAAAEATTALRGVGAALLLPAAPCRATCSAKQSHKGAVRMMAAGWWQWGAARAEMKGLEVFSAVVLSPGRQQQRTTRMPFDSLQSG